MLIMPAIHHYVQCLRREMGVCVIFYPNASVSFKMRKTNMEASWSHYSLEVVLKVEVWIHWEVLWSRDLKVEENTGGEQSENRLEYQRCGIKNPDKEYIIPLVKEK